MLVVYVDRLLLRVDHVGGRVQRLVDLKEVVVAGRDVALDARTLQPLLSEVHPPFDALLHQLLEQLVDQLGLRRKLLDLLRLAQVRIEPRILDALDGLVHLFLRFEVVGRPPELALVAPIGLLDDGDDHLPRDVPAEHQDAGVVELPGVDELPEAPV